jgi:phosphate-selective porin OprO/OprP
LFLGGLACAIGVDQLRGQEPEEVLPAVPAEAEELPVTASLKDDADEDSDWKKRFEKLEADWKKFREGEQAKKEKAAHAPTFKMGGQVIVDAVWFDQSDASRMTVGDVNDSLYFRRARLYASGDAFEVFSYAIGFDFAQGSGNNGRPAFIDNWIQIAELPVLQQVKIGHFFEPFTLERSSSNRNVSFMERSLVDAFAPSRNTGVMSYGTTEDQALFWAVGAFHGNSDNFGDDAGDREGVAFDERLCWRPYYDEPSGGRYYLHLGSAYSFREAPDGFVQYRSRPEAAGQGDGGTLATPNFVDTGLIAAHNAQQFGGELLWTHGSFSLQGEYVAVTVDRNAGANLFLHGGYVHAGYFLTGEHRPYNRANAILDRVIPFENFFRVKTGDGPIATGSGAWEVALRLSYIDLTSQNIDGGRLTDLTVGLNWYLTPYNRAKFNYILANLDRNAITSQTSIFGVRYDMDF